MEDQSERTIVFGKTDCELLEAKKRWFCSPKVCIQVLSMLVCMASSSSSDGNTGTSKLTYLKPKNVGFPAQKFANFSLWVWEVEKRETISATLASRPSAERLAPLRLNDPLIWIRSAQWDHWSPGNKDNSMAWHVIKSNKFARLDSKDGDWS